MHVVLEEGHMFDTMNDKNGAWFVGASGVERDPFKLSADPRYLYLGLSIWRLSPGAGGDISQARTGAHFR
jgi:hypothetical protein